MTLRSAPRAATWLLEHFGGPAFGPIIGDLAEQYTEGRTRIWYWRQALGALAIRWLGITRRHGSTFTAALVAGSALNWALEQICSLTFKPVYQNLPYVKLHPWSEMAVIRLSGMVANTLFWCAICFSCAWLVTRVHRSHQRIVLMSFVLVQVVLRLLNIVPLAFAKPQDTVALATQIILTGQHVVFVLVSGLWAVRMYRTGKLDGTHRQIRLVSALWLSQVLLTALIFGARRVGELSYARPEGYLSLYALSIVGGLYASYLLWNEPSAEILSKSAARA